MLSHDISQYLSHSMLATMTTPRHINDCNSPAAALTSSSPSYQTHRNKLAHQQSLLVCPSQQPVTGGDTVSRIEHSRQLTGAPK